MKLFGEMSLDEYESLGFKCGLEIHQQLLTEKKLFCRCPSGLYSKKYDAEILRHMRPTLSELGEYDGTALMEFKTKKDIIYRLNNESVCTYEFDDTPPFPINQEALDIALEIAMLLKCNLISELHISRKQYLDGSIPTGFQRTTIVGIDGEIPYNKSRKIRIRQLGLEEDACREIADVGHTRFYNTDRLGMPLVETVTYADMRNPWEVADCAQIIRRLTRITGKVRTGIGSARQDVNVSIQGGTRVEIKGVSRIPLIPKLVHNEAMRQKSLLEIREELKKRGLKPETYRAKFYNVSSLLKKTGYEPINSAIKNKLLVKAVLLPKFKGILSYPTQPDVVNEACLFEKEVSDRVRVIACLDKLPNIISTETRGETLNSRERKKILEITGAGEKDTVVLVWGDRRDSETGAKEIELRAKEAITGVPNETRQALKDGTNGFERILPGPNRMYPDTDLPPIEVSAKRIEKISRLIPEPVWEKEARYKKIGIPDDIINSLIFSNRLSIFDKMVENLTKKQATLVGVTITQTMKHLSRKGIDTQRIPDKEICNMFSAYKKGRFFKEIIPFLLEKMVNISYEKAYKELKLAILDTNQVRKEIEKAFKEYSKGVKGGRLQLERFIMGKVMNKIRGKADGKLVRRLIHG